MDFISRIKFNPFLTSYVNIILVAVSTDGIRKQKYYWIYISYDFINKLWKGTKKNLYFHGSIFDGINWHTKENKIKKLLPLS